MQNLILFLAVISFAPLDAFDLFKKDHLIPSDGFHDVLGLVPFWLSESFPDNGLRRTLGSKWHCLTLFSLFLIHKLLSSFSIEC